MRIRPLTLGLLVAASLSGCSGDERPQASTIARVLVAAEPAVAPEPDQLELVALEYELEHEESAHDSPPAGPAADLGDSSPAAIVVGGDPFFARLDTPPQLGTTAADAVAPRTTIPAPAIVLTAAGAAHFVELPARPGRIPVLLFHQICAVTCGALDTYGVSQVELARMLLAIEAAGFTTISITEYVRAMHGDTSGLPRRPILVTFDDGRLDAYRGADEVLRRHHAKATMYVMTAELDRASSVRMSDAEVGAAFQSGRWDIQVHAHAGHVLIQAGVDADGGPPALLPFYASRRYVGTATDGAPALEPFDAWRTRAATDLEVGCARVAARTGGDEYASLTFAVPFGNFGQGQTNDRAIAPELRAMLDARFAVWFTQPGNPDFTGPAPDAGAPTTHEAGRYTIRLTTTAETLYDWLALRSRSH